MIFHIGPNDKFIEPFIDLLERRFTDVAQNHRFYIYSDSGASNPIRARSNVMLAEKAPVMHRLNFSLTGLYRSDLIILHGLMSTKLVLLLLVQPWVLKRCAWVIWGKDLYEYNDENRSLRWKLKELAKKLLIPRLGFLVTQVQGDVALARQWYGAKGTWIQSFMYPSNVFCGTSGSCIACSPDGTTNILIGNSADASNGHDEIFSMLLEYRGQNIHLFAPLSYGDDSNATRVAALGSKLFGNKFTPLLEFMVPDAYQELLDRIDIAVFNHQRQQAMGNIINLLGKGKKVYMRTDVTHYSSLTEAGAVVFDIDDFNIDSMRDDIRLVNERLVTEYFSEANLVAQLTRIFEGDKQCRI